MELAVKVLRGREISEHTESASHEKYELLAKVMKSKVPAYICGTTWLVTNTPVTVQQLVGKRFRGKETAQVL